MGEAMTDKITATRKRHKQEIRQAYIAEAGSCPKHKGHFDPASFFIALALGLFGGWELLAIVDRFLGSPACH
jgi:hypothetical protein